MVTAGYYSSSGKSKLRNKKLLGGILVVALMIGTGFFAARQNKEPEDPYKGLVVGERFIPPEKTAELYSIEGTVQNQSQNQVTLKYIDDKTKQETIGDFTLTEKTIFFSTPDYLDAAKKQLKPDEKITISYNKTSKEIITLWYEYGVPAQ